MKTEFISKFGQGVDLEIAPSNHKCDICRASFPYIFKKVVSIGFSDMKDVYICRSCASNITKQFLGYING